MQLVYSWAVLLGKSLWAVSAQLSLSTSLFKAAWRKHNPAASSLAWSDAVKLSADSFWTTPRNSQASKNSTHTWKIPLPKLPKGGRCTSGSYSPRTAAILRVSAAYSSSHQILVQVLHSLLSFIWPGRNFNAHRCQGHPLWVVSLGMRNAT